MKNLEKGKEVIYQFKKLADTRNYKYKVFLTFGEQLDADDIYKGMILSISDTPGAWYLSTLFESNHCALEYKYMPIYGKEWNCYNWQEIVKELKEIALPKILPILNKTK